MNSYFLIQLAVYEIFDVIPFIVLATAPFRSKIRLEKRIAILTAVLYLLGFARRYISLAFPSCSAALSVLWTALYLAFYYYVIREPLSKLLFVLITVLNYASIIAIIYSYLGYHLFSRQITQNPYCLEASLSILLILSVTYPFFFYWFVHELRPLMEAPANDHIWKTLWLVPATFYVFFYYNIYSSESILSFSASRQNLIFSLVISAGSFFVLILVLRLVRINAFASRLLSERHQLELHNLQYQRLSDRIDEARRTRHDLRQLLTVLQVYLENEDMENLRSYIKSICASFAPDTPMVVCPHPALNALICYYLEICSKLKISFHAQADCPEDIGVQNTDLAVLCGNLLENATEACHRQETGERFIRLKVQKTGGQLIITLDNSFSGAYRKNGDSFYSSKRPGYGIGISSVRQIAEKYHGTARFQVKESVFFASVILNVEES